MMRAVIVGFLVVGPSGLSCLGRSTAVQTSAQPGSPAATTSVDAHGEPQRAGLRSIPPPPAAPDLELYDDDDYLFGVKTGSKPAPPPPLAMDSNLLPQTQALVATLQDETIFALGGVGIRARDARSSSIASRVCHRRRGHERFEHPALGARAAAVFVAWERELEQALVTAGMPGSRAGSVAALILAAVEGVLILCRARRDIGPLEPSRPRSRPSSISDCRASA